MCRKDKGQGNIFLNTIGVQSFKTTKEYLLSLSIFVEFQETNKSLVFTSLLEMDVLYSKSEERNGDDKVIDFKIIISYLYLQFLYLLELIWILL